MGGGRTNFMDGSKKKIRLTPLILKNLDGW